MSRRSALLLALLWAPLAAGSARAGVPDWAAVADVEQVVALTTDADGSPRETTIWLVVVDGQGFVRAGAASTWGVNAARDSALALRIGGAEYALRAEPAADADQRERVSRAFRDKYGTVDALLDVFRGSPKILRLSAP